MFQEDQPSDQVDRDREEIKYRPSGVSNGSKPDDCVMWSEGEMSEQHIYSPNH